MKENMRRLYLYNRANDTDTIAYINESVLTALNSEITTFSQLQEHMTPPARKAALGRLDACEHDAPEIEVTPRHHTLMNWEFLR